ncbi:5-formyltetrahydrofolate cyclo-ligase [Ixodes scapularis]
MILITSKVPFRSLRTGVSELLRRSLSEMTSTDASSMRAAKNAIRIEMKKKLQSMSAEDKLRQSAIVLTKFLSHNCYKSSSRISIYISTDAEVSTEPMIRQILKDGKECFIPNYDMKTQQMDMVKLSSMEELSSLPLTKWNIKQHEHFDPKEEALITGGLDLLVVPGVAFTPEGGRLGHGKGYYDIYYGRCLKQCPDRRPHTIGLCFTQQIVPSIPMHEHDLIVDHLLHAEE